MSISTAKAKCCGWNPVPSPASARSSIDKDSGDIADETYTSLPTNYVIRRVGQVRQEDRADLRRRARSGMDAADSGHPEGRSMCPATFFVIGANMEAHPGLVQRILRRRP